MLLTIFFPLIAHATCVKGDCHNGKGEYLFKSGAKYSGDFNSNKMHGRGILHFTNGDKYMGEWKNNKRHGNGRFIFANGDVYTGEFFENEFNGRGIMKYHDDRKISGYWKDGIMAKVDAIKPEAHSIEDIKNCNSKLCHQEGGRYRYEDGSIYEGSFINGKPQGEGSCYYKNGNVYKGEWQEDAPHGIGVLRFANGREVGGKWHYGEFKQEIIPEQSLPVTEVLAAKSTSETKIYAVIVGVSKYSHMPVLNYTDDDAFRFYAFLKSPEGGALSDDQITLLIDEGAKRDDILKALKEQFSMADPNDVIMMYFSGHGLQGSFLPFDYNGYQNRILHEELMDILDDSEAQHKLCIADACYSGSLRSKGLESSLKRFYSLLNKSSSSNAFLSSSKTEEVSLEDQGLRQGIFTHYLIKGLKGGADQNGDKAVTIREIFKYVHSQVRSYTGNAQTPMIEGTFDPELPLAHMR